MGSETGPDRASTVRPSAGERSIQPFVGVRMTRQADTSNDTRT